MTYISLREIIDDVLLLVRNNNISESEDLSRALIESWVKSYRRQLWKERRDAIKDRIRQQGIFDIEALADDEFFKIKETGPHELEDVESKDESPTYTKKTLDTFDNIFNNHGSSILSVHDLNGENIQYMNHVRRHYLYFRKYTFGELTAYYQDDKHIYVQGLQDGGNLRYIYVLALYEMNEDDQDNKSDDHDPDEDDIKIPAWMIPAIKERIMKNELAFMLNRPSDDSNNATLASVKPNGPQDQEE